MTRRDRRTEPIAKRCGGIQPAARFLLLIALCLLAGAVGCASSKLGARSQVASANGPITASRYAPEPAEECRELGRQACRYWDDPSRSVSRQCAESAQVAASNLHANYIHVDEPSSTDLHYDTDVPTAIFYRCTSLIED